LPHRFAAQHNIIVVLLDDSKSPNHKFPTAIHDIATAAAAVIADENVANRPLKSCDQWF
jgi:acetyl esterase/lipase